MAHTHGHGHGDGTAKAVGATLLVNVALTALKWTAFAVTRSPSLFGEAAHSTADTANPLLLWFGVRRSRRPSHPRHPLGHGREAYFWSLIAAQTMLLVGSMLTAVNGIDALRTGRVPDLSPLALGIMALALLGEGYSLLLTVRGIRGGVDGRGAGRGKNPVLLALVVENGADMLGVLLALCGYGVYCLTGEPLWDALFSLAIAAMLACTSFFLIRKNLSLIAGETAPDEVVAGIRNAALGVPSVAEVTDVVATMAGPDCVACRISVRLDRSWLISAWGRQADSLRPEDAVTWTAARVAAERAVIAAAVREANPHVIDAVVSCA